ncbi:P22 phage major capsid protein family protein [Nocardia otitidiscaviarum]|uniref:P22 phage major capsid protein family protein n=1 Tax=Nocardia otitidiscaviarum TaxID=1823 RepID=UPI0004A6CF17|nr:P22 phage major capsid protein family protein [Nocardia otitidiscaviarum]
MANTLLTPDVIAKQALANLYEKLCMVPLVYTDVSQEWRGQKVGATVTIRQPATFTAQDFDRQNPGITIQNATETGIPVTLDTHKDVSFQVTAEDLTLHLEDFDSQFLTPAAEAIAQAVDRSIIAQAKADFTQVAGTQTGYEWNKPEVLIEADRQLNIKNVPASERSAVIGPSTRAPWLNTDMLKHADKSGSTEALRKGSLGRDIFGFETFMTQNIVQPAGSPASGQPTTEVGLAFHKTAVAFASATLALPTDNTWATVVSYKGLSLRLVKQYDMQEKAEVMSLDILYGTKTLDADRGVLLRGALAP